MKLPRFHTNQIKSKTTSFVNIIPPAHSDILPRFPAKLSNARIHLPSIIRKGHAGLKVSHLPQLSIRVQNTGGKPPDHFGSRVIGYGCFFAICPRVHDRLMVGLDGEMAMIPYRGIRCWLRMLEVFAGLAMGGLGAVVWGGETLAGARWAIAVSEDIIVLISAVMASVS